jgi:hypothetical protein
LDCEGGDGGFGVDLLGEVVFFGADEEDLGLTVADDVGYFGG